MFLFNDEQLGYTTLDADLSEMAMGRLACR